jgi:hypothetical protein
VYGVSIGIPAVIVSTTRREKGSEAALFFPLLQLRRGNGRISGPFLSPSLVRTAPPLIYCIIRFVEEGKWVTRRSDFW